MDFWTIGERTSMAFGLAVLIISGYCLAGIAHGVEQVPPETGFRISGKVFCPGTGDIFLALVTADEWKKNSGFKHQTILRWKDQNRAVREVEFVFQGVAPGEYGLKVFQDKNGNGKLDFIFGPVEPWGFYRPSRPALRGPVFKEVAFLVNQDLADIAVELK